MDIVRQLQVVIANLSNLGRQKLIALAAVFVLLLVAVIMVGTLLGAGVTAPLYTGLQRDEVHQMSRVLTDAGIEFTIDADNTSIMVEPHRISETRMLLAEHGLPASANSGYEVFDNINTLGLTSFMQEVTRIRAIEGELAKTILMIRGIRAARVHVVLPNERQVRTKQQENPSASVVISARDGAAKQAVRSIRHLVAGAIKGLEVENVTVLNTEGKLLASTGDDVAGGSSGLIDLETIYESDIRAKITEALAPYLGIDNFRVSATAKLNTDRRSIEETVFDPETRVERSVRVVREKGASQNTSTTSPTTVTENLPDDPLPVDSGQSESENKERREELTNYEIGKRSVSTVSDGYTIDQISIAAVINRARIIEVLGVDAGSDRITQMMGEIEAIIRSTAAVSDERGDQITVSLVDFLPGDDQLLVERGSWLADFLPRHFSVMLQALAAIGSTLILALLGIRPLLGLLAREPDPAAQLAAPAAAQLPPAPPASAAPPPSAPPAEIAAQPSGFAQPSSEAMAPQVASEGLAPGAAMAAERHPKQVIQERLGTIVAESSDSAAAVIKDWLVQPGDAR